MRETIPFNFFTLQHNRFLSSRFSNCTAEEGHPGIWCNKWASSIWQERQQTTGVVFWTRHNEGVSGNALRPPPIQIHFCIIITILWRMAACRYLFLLFCLRIVVQKPITTIIAIFIALPKPLAIPFDWNDKNNYPKFIFHANGRLLFHKLV